MGSFEPTTKRSFLESIEKGWRIEDRQESCTEILEACYV